MHTLIRIQCESKSRHARTQCPNIGRSGTSLLYSTVSRFTVTRPKVGGEGSGRCAPNNDAGAPFSSSRLQRTDIHPATQLTSHINKHKRVHSRACDVVTTPWTPCSWGILLRSWEWERGTRAALPARGQKAAWPRGSG